MAKGVKPEQRHLQAFINHMAENLTVVESTRNPGSYYVTIPQEARNADIAGITGRIDFAWLGLGVTADKQLARNTRLMGDVEKADAATIATLKAKLAAMEAATATTKQAQPAQPVKK